MSLGKKCPYSEFFWSAFFQHFPTFGLNTLYLSLFSPNPGKCAKNAGQNNSEYGHFLPSVLDIIIWNSLKMFLFTASKAVLDC